MGDKGKAIRNLRHESRRYRLLVILSGFFLVSLAFIVVSRPEATLFSKLSLNDLPSEEDSSTIAVKETVQPSSSSSSSSSGDDSKPEKATEESKPKWGDGGEEESEKEQQDVVVLQTATENTNSDAAQKEQATDSIQSDTPEKKQLCDFSGFRSNICEMEGNIVIHPNSSSIIFVESSSSPRNEEWKIQPYPRKGDKLCLSHVTELTVRSSQEAPQCTEHHTAPGLVFSISGYTGNLFHDFTDIMVPLFTTANQFNGELQFLLVDMHIWWVRKYHKVLSALSNYPVIDLNNSNDQVHCFNHVIVGLRAHREFTIDPSISPNGVSMVDFARFMRKTYGAEREATTALGEVPYKKPRLLVIKRKRTRSILNLDEIAHMAEELGFEVVMDEAGVSSDMSQFAKVVNSCDVMMGVHGAGLTNAVFLPPKATLIQIVPWGGLEGIARMDFGDPVSAMGLRYSQYSITINESTLTDKYPRDHDILKNPVALHKRGFAFIRHTFLDGQNVKLDAARFRTVLIQALDHLNQ